MVCDPNRGGEPKKIGVVIVSSAAKCAACDKFESCDLPPAFLARIALGLALRAAAEAAEDAELLELHENLNAVRAEMKKLDALQEAINRDINRN
jgi:hypothetical protein